MSDKTENLAARISLRPVVLPADEEFLIKLYRGTREDLEMMPVGDEQKKMIMQMQYSAQKQQYAAQFPNAAHDIILFDKEVVGRFMVERGEREIIGVDLAILPERRNLGIGTVLLQNSFKEAAETNRIFSFHVLKTNIALRLYDRLGTVVTEDLGTHFKMEWRPPPIIN